MPNFYFSLCRCGLIQEDRNIDLFLRNQTTSLYLKTSNLHRNTLMNVTIDRMACVSCGACWNTCPELFDQNHCDSFSEVVEEYRFNGDQAEGIVPDCLCCCAQEAADLCPVHVIRIF